MHMIAAVLLGIVSILGSDNRSTLHVRVSGIPDARTREFVESVAHDAISALPRGFTDGLFRNDVLEIAVESLNDEPAGLDVCVSSDKTFGYLDRRRARVVLSAKLVDHAWQRREATGVDFDCRHRTFVRMLEATIVHELAHAYDDRHGASDAERLVTLAGGEKAWLPFRGNRIRNYNAAGSPDPYEFRNLEEAFAVNFEYYQMDADYPCARPGWSAYFDSLFGVAREADCRAHREILLNSHVTSDNLERSVSLDPDRIYEVHYLHASEGEAMASRWGHAMFRLVVCAPWRDAPGPDCIDDVSHDLVLSYRANIADLTINYIRGLFGSYPSQLFVYELPEIIKEYTRLEFRDLVSVPIAFTPDELETFLAVTLERYWNYEGKYYFLWNHCGTETVRHLAAAAPAKAEGIGARTPRRIYRTLAVSDAVDKSRIVGIVSADEPSPYFFPSMESEYAAAFDALQAQGLFPGRRLDELIEDSRAPERAELYGALLADASFTDASRSEREATLANLLLIERLLQDHEQKKISEGIVRLLLGGDAATLDAVKVAVAALNDQPWDVVNAGGYGVPSRDAVDAYLADYPVRRAGLDVIERVLYEEPRFAVARVELEALRRLERMLSMHLVAAGHEATRSVSRHAQSGG